MKIYVYDKFSYLTTIGGYNTNTNDATGDNPRAAVLAK